MKLELVLIGLLIGSIYTATDFYGDKVDAELKRDIAVQALADSVSDTNKTKASYKQALVKIDNIRKEAEREKCKLKTLNLGGFDIEL